MKTRLCLAVGMLLQLGVLRTQAVVYVDAGATGAADGSSWANAFTNLQAAIAGSPAGSELWARSGTYSPITLRTNTLVYGGFAGAESNREDRNWSAYPTTIDGAAGVGVAFASDAALDGFIITNTAGASGAINFNRVNGTLANCRIEGHNGGDALVLTSTGGFTGAASWIRNCRFVNNRGGSAIFYYGRTNLVTGPHVVTIDRCTLVGNQTAGAGGAIRTDQASSALTIENCVFNSNTAGGSGGGMYAAYSSFNDGTPVAVWNCTFLDNNAAAGKAICVSFQTAQVQMLNCIVWGATNDQLRTQNDTPTLLVGASDLQGGFASTYQRHGTITDLGGLIAADPLFVDSDGADNVAGTVDDNLRLTEASPCIDVGTSAGAPNHDGDRLSRPQGQGIDMGAYEYAGRKATGILLQVW